jgi:putrescine aminotransferase
VGMQTCGQRLLSVDDALKLQAEELSSLHSQYLNAGLMNIMKGIGLDHKFVKAEGFYVWDEQGERYLDFLGGYGALNIGHNHPGILETMEKVRSLPNLLQSAPGIMAGVLARNLAMITPGDLKRSFFCNSGAEAVEGALKLARAATHRSRIVYASGGFHGKTFGALSVTGKEKYRAPFKPLLPDTVEVPFGDLDSLRKELKNQAAAFIVEPIQGEGGVMVPPDDYLPSVRALCDQYGALLILDEIQTGLGRTGKMFACQHVGVVPDILCLGKTLGGGVMPAAAYLTTDALWRKAYGGMNKCLLHTSTFGGNTRACAAGIATLNVLIDENLAENAAQMGNYLMNRLQELKAGFEAIKEVRGKGLLVGLELKEMAMGLYDRLSGGLAGEYYAAVIAGELLNKYKIITAYTLNNPRVIRLEPPLSVTKTEIDYLIDSLKEIFSRNNPTKMLLSKVMDLFKG